MKKEFRGRGIDKSLVEKVMKKFEGLKVDHIFVTTEKENRESIGLYQKLGFKLCEEPWLYWNPK